MLADAQVEVTKRALAKIESKKKAKAELLDCHLGNGRCQMYLPYSGPFKTRRPLRRGRRERGGGERGGGAAASSKTECTRNRIWQGCCPYEGSPRQACFRQYLCGGPLDPKTVDPKTLES